MRRPLNFTPQKPILEHSTSREDEDLKTVLAELESLSADLKSYQDDFQLKRRRCRPLDCNFHLVNPLPPNPVPPLLTGSTGSLYDNYCPCRRDQCVQTQDDDLKTESDSTGDYIRDFDALGQFDGRQVLLDDEEEGAENMSPLLKKSKLSSISSPTSNESSCSASTSMTNFQQQKPVLVFISPCYYSSNREKKSVSFSNDEVVPDEVEVIPPTKEMAPPPQILAEDDENRRIIRAYEEGRPLSYTITEWEEPKYQDYHKTDRYGFIHDMRLPDNYSEEEARLVKKQAERERKWKKMLARWEKVPRDKLTNRIYKGIPDSFRSGAWSKLLGVETMKKRHPNLYQDLLNYGLANSRHIRQMDIDINRTFRDHVMFRERYSVKQRQLFHVLVAFSVYDAEVGYCQGMSTLVAFLLMYFEEEEDCFWAIVVLFNGLEVDDRHLLSRYRMHGFYIDGFPKFQRFREHHAILLKRYMPRLNKHFEKMGFRPELYLLKWLLDVFIGGVPVPLLLRIWDIFLLEGERILSAFAFCIVKMHEKRLGKLRQMEDLLSYFQNLGNGFGTSDDVVIQCLQTTIDDLIRDKMLLPFVPSSSPTKIVAPASELPKYRLGVIPPEIEIQVQQQSPKPKQLFDDSNVQPMANTPIIIMEDVVVSTPPQPIKQAIPPPPPVQQQKKMETPPTPPQVPPPFVEQQQQTTPVSLQSTTTKNVQLKENIVVTFVDEPVSSREKAYVAESVAVTTSVLGQKTDNSYNSTPVKQQSTPQRQHHQVAEPRMVMVDETPPRVRSEISTTVSASPGGDTSYTSYSYSSYSPSYSPSPSKVAPLPSSSTNPAYQHVFQPLKSVSETLSELAADGANAGSSPSPNTQFSLALAQAKMERDLREAEARRLRHQQARAEFFRAMLASGSLYSRGSTDYDDSASPINNVSSASRYMSQSAYQQVPPGTNGHMSESSQQKLESSGGQVSSSFTLIPVIDDQPQAVEHHGRRGSGGHGSRRSSSSSKHAKTPTTPRNEQPPMLLQDYQPPQQQQQEVVTTFTATSTIESAPEIEPQLVQEAEYDNILTISGAELQEGDYSNYSPQQQQQIQDGSFFASEEGGQTEQLIEVDEMLHNSYYEEEPRVIMPTSASFDSQQGVRRSSSKGSPIKEPQQQPPPNGARMSQSSSVSSQKSQGSLKKSTSVHSDV